MRKVFVSYSRNNLDAVAQLVKDLQDVGFSAWHDQTLTGGQRWWDNILTSIRECDIFIFALSKESWDSEACQSELAYVVELGKPILPVLVADNIHLSLLSAPLNEIQVTNYLQRDKAAAFSLLKAINSSPAAPPLPDPLPSPPPVPLSYLGALKDRIESASTLSAQEQNLLFLEIEGAIDKGRSPAEIRDLLMTLKQRDDLLATVGRKVDEALKRVSTPQRPSWQAPPLAPRPVPKPSGANAGGHNRGLVPTTTNCPQCKNRTEPDWRFCLSCGTELPTTRDTGCGQIPGSTSRRYACSPDVIPQIISDVRGWLNQQDFDTQQISADHDSVLLQIKKRGSWRDLVGMATSLNVVFHAGEENTLTVEIGAGKWIDKAAVGTVSLLILWPLAITAGIGAWEQMKMPENIFEYIGSRLAYR
ncbi:MAG TPA: TIR domain-containing protein [Pyrinomonadaceae bacterium]|nr:TIR domain-containing protein [Pyrinomonadaceae bacterium]